MEQFPVGCEVIEICPGQLPAKLHFFSAPNDYKPPSSSESMVFFCTDEKYIYTSFFADFGPLDLGQTHSFCKDMEKLMAEAAAANKGIAYYTRTEPNRQARSNSAVLVCAYLVLAMDFPPEKAYSAFLGMPSPFTPFRDAAFALNTWPLFVLDCCKALSRAKACGHFDYRTFIGERFSDLAQLHNGDISWIVPGKLAAFSGPLAQRKELASGKMTMIPEDYCPLFKQLGINCVVRFNNKCYDKRIFERSNIKHVDLFYEDGGNPTESILQSFLQLCETHVGAIAVHCKAGLGRTGTNICAYMVKHLGYTVRESVAWHRMCRPGAVVGPQQQYLCSIEDKLVAEGRQYRAKVEAQTAQRSAAAGGAPSKSPGSSRGKQIGASAASSSNSNNSGGSGSSKTNTNGLTSKLAKLNV